MKAVGELFLPPGPASSYHDVIIMFVGVTQPVFVNIMRRLPCILLALLVAGCNRVSIETNYDKSADFRKYRTYALDTTPAEIGALSRHTLEETLRESLGSRGLSEVPPAQADLFVVCRITTEQKQVNSPVGGQAYFSSNFGRYSEGSGVVQAPQLAEQTYGSLIIDFVDAHSRQLVFRGIGGARINVEEKNAAAIQTVVRNVVAAIPRLGTK
jgi:hypothetical protein